MEDKRPVSHLLELIKDHLSYLRKYQEEIINPLNYGTFPTRPLILFYEKRLIPKLDSRKKTSQILSDILMWNTPRFIGFCHQILAFIQNLSPADRKANLNSIKPDLPADCTVESMLRVPYIFLQETLLSHVRASIHYSKDKQWNVEARSLTYFADIYEGFLHDYSESKQSSEEVQVHVLRKLYPDVEPGRRGVAMKYCFRLSLISVMKEKAKKAEKRLKDRKMRLQELVDGERKYTAGLADYIQFIKKPIQQLNVLSAEQDMKLFSTIESIHTFHKQFHEALNAKFSIYDKYQTYGDIFRKNIPFFKLYNDYILYADQAEKILLELQENNPQVEAICSQFMEKKEKKASDELKQPTFRIARYDMILSDLLKKTNPDHPDYSLLSLAQKEFVASLVKINNTVDATFRRNRLHQLEQEFGTEERPIFEPKREFMEEFQLFLVKEDQLTPVIVFVFNDSCMVIDSETRKVWKWIKIDEGFFVRREEDNKIYRNIIKVHSDGFITFSAGGDDKNFNKAQQFFLLLSRVSKETEQSNRMVYVQVIGTQQIGSTSFAKHTEYIVEIKYMGLRKFVHLRFSEMKPLVNKMQEHYKNDLNITEEESLRKNWFNNHKSKTIEDRKRTIEQILQKILNHEIVKQSPDFALQGLGIEDSFMRNSQSPEQRRQTIIANHSSALVSQLPVARSKKKESKEAETILCATEIKLGNDLYHDPEESYMEKKKIEGDKIEIYVHTMVDEEPVVVKINEYFSVEDVCHKVSKLIGLRMNRDFRLFHQIGKKELRVLDPEQKIMKIFNFPKKAIVNGPTAEFFNSIKRIVAPDTHPTLIFKKYYFLPVQIQQSQAKRDLTRLRLLVYQIFGEIKEMKYQLTFDEYLLFLAMMVYIQFDGEVREELDQSFVSRLIPETIFKLKNYTEQQWLAKCRPHMKRLDEQIRKIIEYNKQQLKNKRIKADSVSKTALYFGHRHLCSQIVINKIKSNPIYGSNLFYVQPYKSTYDKLTKENKKMTYNMWLAIKVESLNLLTPSSKETVLQLQYKDIEKIFVYSEAIIFKMDGLITTEYRFNTYQSFEISQLVKYNKSLNDTLLELDRDEDLIARARTYKQELLIYRNTYDKDEKGA